MTNDDKMVAARKALAEDMLELTPMTFAIFRLSKGFSVQDLANAIGLDPVTLSYMEAGLMMPSYETMVNISISLGVSLNEVSPFFCETQAPLAQI